jgi:Dehydrogenases with different specificities (related to short-chain alcohol dehydrogenases)
MFGYFEGEESFVKSLEGMSKESINNQWQELMSPYFEFPEGAAPDESNDGDRRSFSLRLKYEVDMRLENKNALITGSGNGIGRAIAELFAKEGANVVVADLEKESGLETVATIRKSGGGAKFLQVDTSAIASVGQLVMASINHFGAINIFVNNAAAFVFGYLDDVSPSVWVHVFGVPVLGYAPCVKHSFASLTKGKGRSIIIIASVSSFIAHPEFVPYPSSKGAVIHLSTCFAMALANYKIRVNSICPGSFRTRATDEHLDSFGLDPATPYNAFGNDSLLKGNRKSQGK